MRVKQDHPPRTTDGTYKIVHACSSYHLKRGKEGPKSICFHWFPILQYFWTKKIPFSSNLQNDDTHFLANRFKLSTNWEESRCNLDAFHNPHACRVISVLTRSNLHLDLGIKPFTLPPRHILILEFHLHVLERWNCWNPVKNTKIHRRPSPCQERHGHLPGHPKFEVEDQKPPSEIPAGTARSGRSTVEISDLRGST